MQHKLCFIGLKSTDQKCVPETFSFENVSKLQADFDKLDATVGQIANGIKQTLDFCGQLFGEDKPEANSTTACLEKLKSDSSPDSRRKRRSEISDDEELFWDEGEFEVGSGDFEEGSGDYPDPDVGSKPDPIPCSELATMQCDDLITSEGDFKEINEMVEETSEEFVEDFKRMSDPDADSNPVKRWCPEPGSNAANVFKVGGKVNGDYLSISIGNNIESYEDSARFCDRNNGLHHRWGVNQPKIEIFGTTLQRTYAAAFCVG